MTIQGSSEPRSPQSFQEIEEAECMALLASRVIGRVAFDGDDGIAVYPVNHVVHEGAVYFRTSAYGAVVRRLRFDDRVAFEVDDVDEYLRSGWSVLVSGRAELLDAHEALESLPSITHPEPWAAGSRKVTVRVRPRRLTGRRVLPV